MKIIVGSKAAQKIEAVKAAAKAIGLEAEIIGENSMSGVPEQPFGNQTMYGAYNRARYVASIVKNFDADFYIGIENGIEARRVDVDYACVAIITSHNSDGIFVFSDAVPVPRELVMQVVESKQTVTAGSLEAMRSGCDPADPHQVWSGGKTDRKTILTEAITRALRTATRIEGVLP